MEPEQELASYVSSTRYEDLPASAIAIIKTVVLTNLSGALGGAFVDGCQQAVEVAREWGARPEATLWVHGGKVSAHDAAFANSIMARALDLDDIMQPGIHIGASAVPVALAMAEKMGGCSGRDFLAALVLGTEVAARINAASQYDGFDPVGIATVFATAAISGRLLGLDARRMQDALGLALNRAAGSFQNNVDGALAVRYVQGFAAQAGMVCAQLAHKGVTGPSHFLTGQHGYFHLFAKDQHNIELVAGELGKRYELHKTAFKKYPSSGSTLASTEATLAMVEHHGIDADAVDSVMVCVSRHTFKNAGHAFVVGDNAGVNAQFSIRYCVANALLRKAALLDHFEAEAVRDPAILALTRRIDVQGDADIEIRGRLAASVRITLRDGRVLQHGVDIPAGMPGAALSPADHLDRFHQCARHAPSPWPQARLEQIIGIIDTLEDQDDVRVLIPLMLPA